MKTSEVLNMSWAIALKDVFDAFKNKATRINIIVLIVVVAFFYFMSTLRPFDKRVDVVVLDNGTSSLQLDRTTLQDGSELKFRQAASFPEFEQKMAYQHLGLVLPGDFDQQVAAEEQVQLSGYVHWAQRGKVAELESKYSAMISELLGVPVIVSIGDNILQPPVDALGIASTASFHIYFAILWMALTVVPFLIIEERRTRTMDALLVSPASPGVVVLGKAIAGLILITAIAGFAVALNGIYIINWGWALVSFLLIAIFAIGLALLLGTLIRSPQQVSLWVLPIAILFVIPGFFADEPNLTAGAKAVMDWLPAVAFNRVLSYSVSNGNSYPAMGTNLAIAIVSIIIVYALEIWLIRRSDR
jgi:ABC-2 type transport system permease protein